MRGRVRKGVLPQGALSLALELPARKLWRMPYAELARDLTREVLRRAFVASCLGRTQALRFAYLAYARTLSRQWGATSSKEAVAEMRRRLEVLFEEDWKDAEDGWYPRELITSLPWREYASAAPRLLAD